MSWPRMLLVVFVSLAAASLRSPTRSRTPFSWDPANFALAVERIDLAAHQPHPPAAIGYVAAARLLMPLAGEAHLALVMVNLLFTAAAGTLVFAFAFHASPANRDWHGWLALVTLLTSPLFWFYGCVAEVYVAETCLCLLVAYGCLRVLQGREDHSILAGAALALLAAFRLTGAAFLFPLFAVTLIRAHSRRVALRALGTFLVVTAGWAVPLLLWAGPATYVRVLADHFTTTTGPTSIFTSGSSRVFSRHLREALYALVSGMGLFNLVALPVFLALRRPRLGPGGGLTSFAAVWVLPGLFFYVLVHMAKFGYVLPMLPAVGLTLAFLYGQEPRVLVRTVLVAGQIAVGSWQFLASQPATGDTIGEGRLYRDKSGWQKARVELNSVLQPARAAIAEADRQMAAVERELRASCPGRLRVVLVGRDGAGPNWRRLMYSLPSELAVRLPSTPAAPWMTAHGRRLTVIDGSELAVDEVCRTLWVDPPSAVLEGVRPATALHRVEGETVPLYWTEGRASIALADGHRLTIR